MVIDRQTSTEKVPPGLSVIRCLGCGHRGLFAHDGLHLVFHAGHEFCFTFGLTPAYLTIRMTAEALAVYKWVGLSQELLATYAAEWLLLWGRKEGQYRLSPNEPVFKSFQEYLENCFLPRLRPHVA